MTDRNARTLHWSTLLVGASLIGCGDYAPNDAETGQTPLDGAGGAGAMPSPSNTTAGPMASATPPTAATPEPAEPPMEVMCGTTETACGGDVAGTWTVKDCPLTLSGVLDMQGFGLGCPTAAITSGTLQVSGTWTADASGMFTDQTVTTGTQEVEMTPECLMVSGTVTQCNRVGSPVQSSLGYKTFECVDNPETGGCSCSATIEQEGGLAMISNRPPDDGEFTTMDSTLTVDDDNVYSYCATSNALVVSFPTPQKIGTLSGPIVLQKQ